MSDGIPTPDEALRGFSGEVRLFPLPNLAMFPHVLQPLHIFEPRYREMVREALQSDRLIAMVLLREGWEDDYEGNPPVHSTACLGHIVADRQLEDGRYHIVLRGLARVRILEERPAAAPFRVARVELVDEVEPDASSRAVQAMRDRLIQAFRGWLPQGSQAAQRFADLLDPTMPLGVLTDVIAYTIRLDVERKQPLLAEADVRRRAEQLLACLSDLPPLEETGARRHDFPPEFSEN